MSAASRCMVALAAVLLTACSATQAVTTRVFHMGYLSGGAEAESKSQIDDFRRALGALGYVEGRNLGLEVRYAEGRIEREPALAAELLASRPDVVVARSTPEALALKQATSTVPIVLINVPDVVESGLVASLAHPGGNITGTVAQGAEVAGRRIQLVKEAVTGATRIAYLSDATQASAASLALEYARAASALGVQVDVLDVRSPEDIAGAFDAVRRGRPDALIVAGGPVTGSQRQAIVDFVGSIHLPSMFSINREFVDRGGLMLYGSDLSAVIARAAQYVDRILNGAEPSTLPIEQPSKYDFIINLKAARELGITIPQAVITQATEVIQ